MVAERKRPVEVVRARDSARVIEGGQHLRAEEMHALRAEWQWARSALLEHHQERLPGSMPLDDWDLWRLRELSLAIVRAINRGIDPETWEALNAAHDDVVAAEAELVRAYADGLRHFRRKLPRAIRGVVAAEEGVTAAWRRFASNPVLGRLLEQP